MRLGWRGFRLANFLPPALASCPISAPEIPHLARFLPPAHDPPRLPNDKYPAQRGVLERRAACAVDLVRCE